MNLPTSEETTVASSEAHLQLVESYMLEGEHALLKGDFLGNSACDKAVELEPLNPLLHFRQGLALFDYGCEQSQEKALLLACKKFKKAISLNSAFFEAWHLWGCTLMHLGKTLDQPHYFTEAERKLKRALKISEVQSSDVVADLFWDYGIVWGQIGSYSGEALDLHLAMDAFQKAYSHEEKMPALFWRDFGNSCLQLAARINDVRLYVKAIHCLKTAISIDASYAGAWTLLGNTLELLYSFTHDEDHFTQANECFASAAHLKPEDKEVFLGWAKLLCESGRRTKDIKRLRACIEKCHRAYVSYPDEPRILCMWAESLALLGDFTEGLDLIYEAQNKISEAIELQCEDPDIWFSYGVCLRSFGNYFQDIDYYHQAIEKFQYGLSLDRTCYRNWHAIAVTYAKIGEMEESNDSFEKACRFFNKAINLHPSTFYLYDYALTLSRLGEITHQQRCLEQSVELFERALGIQKNAIYLHPEWLFHYAYTLDMLGDFQEEEDTCYGKAIEILSHVLMIDPDFPGVHHRLALAYSHLGDLLHEMDHFYRAIHHYKLACKHDEENDLIIADWALSLVEVARCTQDCSEADQCYREAEYKLIQAAKLGHVHAYYHLACLYSLLGQYDRAMRFIAKADAFDALPPVEELIQDDWLENLRGTSDFQEFLLHLEQRCD